MPQRLSDQLPDNLDGLEGPSEPRSPPRPATVASPLSEQPRHKCRPDRNSDRPGQRGACGRLRRSADQQDERREAGRRRQQRVLEGTETQDAHPSIATRDSCIAERLLVNSEAAASDEDAEAGRDQRNHLRQLELGPSPDPGELSVGKHVAEIGDRLRHQRQRDPIRLGVQEPGLHLPEARRPGHANRPAESQGRTESNEQRQLPRRTVQVVRRLQSSGGSPPHPRTSSPSPRAVNPEAAGGGRSAPRRPPRRTGT